MMITLNGKSRDITTGTTLQELLDQLHIDCRTVVVEHNRQIVSRQQLAEIVLSADDSLEVIHFVGGG
ncbi:MAG: sulfur carrier protein ThiS [Desulfuromonadales bacterium]|jgi:thiamine biosynthesis protein ThiS